MSAGKIIAYIAAAILIFFGVLFIWATFSPDGQLGWFITGLASVGIGLGLIWLAQRQKPVEPGSQNVTLKIDLPGNVELETLKCRTCGGSLSAKDIEMLAGAPVVTCPYCGSKYQLKEDPKW
jgi:DNA-directed RNA polymerase subunit RPC12/RpoP